MKVRTESHFHNLITVKVIGKQITMVSRQGLSNQVLEIIFLLDLMTIFYINKFRFNLISAFQSDNQVHYGISFPGASAMISKSSISGNYCIGTLTIVHTQERGNIEYVTLKNKRSHYPNIQRGFPIMRRRAVSYMETTGDCCWEFYTKRRFKGARQLLFPGEDTFRPDFKPASIKKLKCTLK